MPAQTTPESFWARTRWESGCLVWTGYRKPRGYGVLDWQGRKVYAHRLAFFLTRGRWPETNLRHLCNNPPCVLHVVEGTHSENVLDQVRAGTHHVARRTHCAQGHPYDEENTYRTPEGKRGCRTCIAAAHARSRLGPLPVRGCDNCGTTFQPKRRDQRFCQTKCRWAAIRRARPTTDGR